MNRTLPIITAVGIVVLLVGAWLLWGGKGTPLQFGAVKPSALTLGGAPYTGAPLTADYKNETFRFALDVPDGFTAGELPEDENGASTIIIQNDKGEGIQIYVTPAGSDNKTLSAESIRSSIPDMTVSDVEEVEIGNDYRGVAFLSDNEAYERNSREVWFYYKGNLYQISTYARLDSLLQAMFATWSFY